MQPGLKVYADVLAEFRFTIKQVDSPSECKPTHGGCRSTIGEIIRHRAEWPWDAGDTSARLVRRRHEDVRSCEALKDYGGNSDSNRIRVAAAAKKQPGKV